MLAIIYYSNRCIVCKAFTTFNPTRFDYYFHLTNEELGFGETKYFTQSYIVMESAFYSEVLRIHLTPTILILPTTFRCCALSFEG